MPDRNVQKILIKPPLGGLNIHDNPLDLNFMFATELTNFKPPTTKLEVRPGIENIMRLGGMPMGLFSYSVGARKVYASGLFITLPGIDIPKYSSIIIKLLNPGGTMSYYTVNPEDKTVVWLGNFKSDKYGADYCMLNNSMVFTDGSNVSSPYIYSGNRGLRPMQWFGPTGTAMNTKNLTDLDNVTAYNGWIFANSVDSLNIYYMNEEQADPEKEVTKKWINKIFMPQSGGYYTLTGVIKRGGSILKMFTIGANQHDNIQAYFCVLTDQGELVLYQGTDPTLIKEGQWKMVGIFEIPVPLNKRCFCQVEGDVIVATQTGLLSLQRLMFGSPTKITEALETKISGLFKQYEFRANALRDHFFLKYYRKNRWLIFNVPTFVPVYLKDVLRGYVFKKGKYLVFDADYLQSQEFIRSIEEFITQYLLLRQINYGIVYTFNNDKVPIGSADKPLGICIDYSLREEDAPDLPPGATRFYVTVKFYITTLSEGGGRTTHHFLRTQTGQVIEEEGWEYMCDYMPGLTTNITYYRVGSQWNVPSLPFDDSGRQGTQYFFEFKAYEPESEYEYEVTDIRPYSSIYGGTLDPDVFLVDAKTGSTPTSRYEMFLASTSPGDIPSFFGPGKDPLGQFNRMPSLEEMLQVYLSEGMLSAPEPNVFRPYKFPYGIMEALFTCGIATKDIGGQDLLNLLDITVTNDILFKNEGGAEKHLIVTATAHIDVKDLYTTKIPLRNGHTQYEADIQIKLELDGVSFFIGTVKCKTWTNIYIPLVGRIQVKDHSIQSWDIGISESGNMAYMGTVSGYQLTSSTTTFNIASDYPLNVPDFEAITGTETGGDFPYTKIAAIRNLPYFQATRGVSGDLPSDNYLRGLGWPEAYVLGSANRYDSSFNETTNYDFSLVPFINSVSVAGPYTSDQYVFNTTYGTWSKWEGINMVDAVEHNLDFYFARTDPTSWAKEGQGASSKTMLCRFNPEYNGDFQDDVGNSTPIVAICKAGHTDIGIPQSKKQFKRVRIFGTESVFWGTDATIQPFIFDYEVDFKPQSPVIYQYYKYHNPLPARFKEMFGYVKPYKDMDYMEKKRYNKLYEELALAVKDIELPLVCPPCDRISLGYKLTVDQHNLVIYGYELYYELVNP
jgi:hypothetical protein